MSDVPLPGARPLTEPERQAFQRLFLTPGHWAALVAAPFVSRRGARGLLLRSKYDLEQLNRLRLQLRVAQGMSDEAGRFWHRLSGGLTAPEIELAQRLLAWHLATDLTYPRRFAFYRCLWETLEYFADRATVPIQDRVAVVMDLYRLVDQYLPVTVFTPHEPGHVNVPAPPPAVLETVARRVAPTQLPWPLIDQGAVRFRLPVTVSLFGGAIREWWFRAEAPRRAAASGMAGLPFDERERLYDNLEREWQNVFLGTHGKGQARDCAARFVSTVREWVDGVRSAVRFGRALWADAPAPAPADHDPVERLAAPIVVAPAPAPPPALDHASALISGGPAREIHPVHIPISPAPTPVDDPPREAAPDTPIPADSVRVPLSARQPPPVPPPAPPPKPKPERVTAQPAAAFEPVALDEALARARAVSVADVAAWVAAAPPLLFDDCREETSREIAVVKTPNAVPKPLWVVGDVHADILALANVIAHAQSQATPDAPAHFLFLGDFVDRGVHDHETLLLLFGLLMAHPDRVCVVPGNHDIDLQFDEAAGRFRVTIEPAEYCEGLNAALRRDTPVDGERVALARAFIRFCTRRPKAVFLPDGTLLAHGGFPHTDAQKDIAALPDLCKPRCLDDFLWARIAESARVKRPNRGSRGHEFGWDTLVQFCKLAEEKLGVPVKRLVRGHDHVTDRWMEYPEYADNGVPVLTLNAMGRLLDGEPARRDGRPHPLPVVGRCVPDHLPEVFVLPLDPVEVDRAFRRVPPRGAEPGPALAGGGEPLPHAAVEEPGPGGREPGAGAAP